MCCNGITKYINKFSVVSCNIQIKFKNYFRKYLTQLQLHFLKNNIF